MIYLYTFADKRPDFIALQYKSLKHFLKDDFRFIVFNNASSQINRLRISIVCKLIGVDCVTAEEQNHADACLACAVPIQWAFHKIMSPRGGYAGIIDSDMFLVRPFSILEYLGEHNIAAVKQIRKHVKYLWNGIMFFHLDNLPAIQDMNFMHGEIDGINTDVGGFLHYWLKSNPNTIRLQNILHTSHIWSGNHNLDCLPEAIRASYNEDYRFELYEHAILHYGRGSNWDKQGIDFHKDKTKLLKKWVNGAISGTITVPDYTYVFALDCWEKNEME
jgi:hypothetical protein